MRGLGIIVGAATVSLALVIVLGGCGAVEEAPGIGADAASTPPASSPPTSSAGETWPHGASAETPRCQDASAAAVSAVNETIDNPNPAEADGVEWLTATPDADHAVWLLTGLIDAPGSEGGYVVAWATVDDPTASDFTGDLRSVGGSAASISSAPVLQFADLKEPGSLPPAAFGCLASR
jgi:hypothetical protein